MDNSLSVFIDTSSLPRNLNHLGLAFERLCQLSQSGLVQVYFSEIVAEEWFTQLDDEWSSDLKAARKSLFTLLRHPWSSRLRDFDVIKSTHERLELKKFELNALSRRNFSELLDQLRAEVVKISADHPERVFENYFSGYSPFSQPKNRNDIPDAFIYECALEIADSLKADLHCIVSDGQLRKSLNGNPKVFVYESIDSFVKTDLVSNLANKLAPARVWNASVSTLIKRLSRLKSRILKELETIMIDVLPSRIVSHGGIPDDNNEAVITGVYEPENVKFFWSDSKDYGPGLIELPFELDVDVSIDFTVFRADAYFVPEGVWVETLDPEEHYYFEAGGIVSIHVTGSLALRFNLSELSDDGLPELEDVGFNKIEEIEIVENEPGKIFHEPRYSQ